MIAWLLVWSGLAFYSFRNPGFGVAVAMVLGQFDFPSRAFPLFPGAPLIVAIVVLSSLHRRVSAPRRSMVPAAAALMLSGIGAIQLIFMFEGEPTGPRRVLLLFAYVAPLAALVATLDHKSLLQFKIWFLRLAVALGAISLAGYLVAGPARVSSLGGGPIPLAQLMGFGIIMIMKFPEIKLVPVVARQIDRYIKLGSAFILGFVAVVTGSRFPVIALVLSFPLAGLLTLISGKVEISGLVRRVAISVASLAAAAYVFPILVGGSRAAIRFALLITGFSGELQRSRGSLFGAALVRAIDALPFGYGPGNIGPVKLVGFPPLDIRYPHNIFLEALGDFGLAGFVVLSTVVAVTFFHRHHSYALSGLLTCAIFSLLIAQTSGDMVHNRYFFAFSAMYLAADRGVRRRGSLDERASEATPELVHVQ